MVYYVKMMDARTHSLVPRLDSVAAPGLQAAMSVTTNKGYSKNEIEEISQTHLLHDHVHRFEFDA